MPSDGGGWINLLTNRQGIFPKSIGDYFDACSYIKTYGVNYIYFGKSYNNDNFDIQLSDLTGLYDIVYETPMVKIIKPKCQ